MRAFVRGMAGMRTPPSPAGDLSMPQLKALLLVWGQGLATSRDIAARLGVGASAVSSLVDRLAAAGLVDRAADPHDRRLVRLSVTPAGAALVESIFLYGRARLTQVLQQLAPDDLALVTRVLALVRVAAEQQADGPAGAVPVSPGAEPARP